MYLFNKSTESKKKKKHIHTALSDSFPMGVIWLRNNREYFPDRLENYGLPHTSVNNSGIQLGTF